MKTFFDPRQLAHAPLRELHRGSWVDYAEKPSRAEQIAAALGPTLPADDFGIEPILKVHSGNYVGFLRGAWNAWQAAGRDGDAIGYTFPVVSRRPLELDSIDAQLGAFSFDAATPITADTWDAAYWSAQCALSGIEAVLAGNRAAFALCRPPGHHAGRDYMGGYCYLNNAAIAARHAQARGCGRVAVLDVDYHHGNGTQDIFYEDTSVLFASIHADPATDYPYYWGHGDEDGHGANLNLPLPRGTDWTGYREALAVAKRAIADWRADMLVVSFGADTFAGDPISSFALGRDDLAAMGGEIAELGLPALVVMEGGYAVGDLGRNVAAFLSGLSSG